MAKATKKAQAPKRGPSAKGKRTTKSAPPPPPRIGDTKSFYIDDFSRTLFPLRTNLVLVSNGEQEIKGHITRCLDENDKSATFLQQKRVYAAKPGYHLRRTVKLDVVAEYYIYDVIYRNRGLFRKPHKDNRTHYGYRFEGGAPIAATAAYKGFRGAISEYRDSHSHSVSLDVASYFNSIYHHDIVNWFRDLKAPDSDVEGLSQLLREIASGRSVDCLPHGLYPTKMIGNDFLRFVENNFQLKSDKIVRFMDDLYVFSDKSETVKNDFITIQRLLGDKGLSINPKKTSWDEAAHVEVESKIDAAKRDLLKRRRILVTIGYDEDDEEIQKEVDIKAPLTQIETDYLYSLLERDEIEEEDAELVLAIMREHSSKVEGRLPYIMQQFPNLTKNVYAFCSHVADKSSLANMILDILSSGRKLMEYQLFWFGYILEDHLMDTSEASDVIEALFNHSSSTTISKAKILEIPDLRYGLPDARGEYLASGASDWLGWSSAVGSRKLRAGSRNHVLKYFGNASPMNDLIAQIVLRMPQEGIDESAAV